MRLGFQRPVISMPAGDLALRLGATEVAINAFAAAIAARPSLAADPWWIADPSRAALMPQVVNRALERMAPNERWEVFLMRGAPTDARGLAAVADDPGFAGDIIAAWVGERVAYDAVLQRCDEDPSDLAAVLWCARLSDRAGDLQGGSRYRLIANIASAGSYRAAHELRVDPAPPKVFPILEGGASIAWGTYTYRRVTAWDVLAPGLLRLGFG
jgi:hypothetical protein